MHVTTNASPAVPRRRTLDEIAARALFRFFGVSESTINAVAGMSQDDINEALRFPEVAAVKQVMDDLPARAGNDLIGWLVADHIKRFEPGGWAIDHSLIVADCPEVKRRALAHYRLLVETPSGPVQ